ncbi:MAG: sulfite exporter TauE/SafE family protein [Burkholderiales bacterium]
MPFPPEVLIAAPLIALVAYTILGISGFGSALVTIPLLAHVLPLTVVVPMVVIVDFIATLTMGLRFRGDVEATELKTVLPTMFAGILAGVALLKWLSGDVLVVALGAVIAGYGLYRLKAPAATTIISPKWGYAAGLSGGLAGGLFGVGGPIYATYMSRRTENYARMRATLSAIFSVSTGFRLLVFLATGLLLQSQVWWTAALILPFMFVGLTIGHKLHGRLGHRQIGIFVSLLLVASGLSLVLRAF